MARKSRKEPVADFSAQTPRIPTAFYIRLSVEADKRHESSIENQRMLLNEYISDKPEFALYEIYIDNGASGMNFQRPAFQRLLADIEAGRIACVIVKDLSRLGRNTIDTGYYIEQYFCTNHVRFISVTDQFDTDDPENMVNTILLPLKNMVNEAYALDIGRKIRSQVRQAMHDGDYVGARALYGYRKDPENCHRLLIDEEAASVVRQIFQWAYEKISLNGIVRRLNESGIDSPGEYKRKKGILTNKRLIGNGKWQTWTVSHILSNETYTGVMVQGKSKMVDHRQYPAKKEDYIVVPGTHEAIVSREVYEAVQKYREEVGNSSKAKIKKSYTPNLFKGKIFCAHCGHALHRQRRFGKKPPNDYRYHCLTNSRIAYGSCEGGMILEKELFPIVTSVLEQELKTFLGESLSLYHMETAQKEQQKNVHAEILAKKQEQERYRKLIRSLYESYVQKILTSEEYLSMKADYEKCVSDISEEIAAAESKSRLLDAQLEKRRSMEKDADELSESHALTAELVERLIDRIDVAHDRSVHIEFRFRNEFLEGGEKTQI